MGVSKRKRCVLISVLSFVFLICVAIYGKIVYAETGTTDSLIIGESGVNEVVPLKSAPENYFSEKVSGIYVETKSTDVVFSYKNVIDANTLSIDKILLKTGFLGMGNEDYGKATLAVLTLTDADDPNNYIALEYHPAIDIGEGNGIHIYYRVFYNKTSRGYDGINKVLWENRYGTLSMARSLYPGKFGENICKPQAVYFDYKDKAFYIETQLGNDPVKKEVVLDLDNPDHIGEDSLWSGFTNDRCKLSFSVTYERPNASGVFVSALLGNDLSNGVDLSTNKPSVIVNEKEYNKNEYPLGAVGVKYPIPQVTTSDFVYGDCDLTINAYRGDKKVNEEITDGYVIPTTEGEMTIEYVATNKDGNSSTAFVKFNVVNKIAPFVYSKSNDEVPVFGEYFDVPTISISGGSGNVVSTEIVEYNGKILDLSKSRKVYIDKAGYISISLSTSGYCGGVDETLIYYSVELDKACIMVDGVPQTAVKGQQLVLPDSVIYQKDGSQSGKTIKVNGVDVTSTLTYPVTETAGTDLTIVYGGGVGSDYNEVVYKARVIENVYSISSFVYVSDGVGTVTELPNEDFTRLNTEAGATFKFAYPVSVSSLNLDFAFNGAFCDSLDIILTDAKNPTVSTFFRMSYFTNTQTSIDVNGVKSKSVIDECFSQENRYLFTIENGKGISYAGKVVAEFEDFDFGGVMLEFRVNGAISDNTIKVYSVSNQLFSPSAFYNGDMSAPVLFLNGNLAKVKTVTTFNGKYLIPGADAFDVLSPDAQVSLKIISPKGTVVYNGDALNDRYITLNEYGVYVISYKVTDSSVNANSINYNYSVEMADTTAPELTVNGGYNAKYKKGEKIKISAYSVKDDIDSSAYVVIYLVDNKSMSRKVITDKSEIVINDKGSYTICYTAYDNRYNVKRIEFTFNVE